eukprot:8072634-Heterocapsa_arctica.AAC.1
MASCRGREQARRGGEREAWEGCPTGHGRARPLLPPARAQSWPSRVECCGGPPLRLRAAMPLSLIHI